jgi:hypothetical protein
MKRLVIYTALAAAAVVPATTGLLSNASFSQTVPVRTPAQAQLLTEASGTATPTATTSPTSPSAFPTRHAEPGDDHGGGRDRTGVRTDEPGDDHGGDRHATSTRTAEAGDDHGGDLDRDARQELGDDRDSSVRHDDGADDHSGSDNSGTDDSSSSGKGSGGGGSDD